MKQQIEDSRQWAGVNEGRCLMRLPLLAALLFLGASISNAVAEDCAEPEDQATMNQCADKAYKAADARLNTAYQKIVARLDEDARKLLTGAQRAWIAYRDAECRFQTSNAAEGSIYPAVLSGCMQSLTQARLKDLETYLSCQEGDLSCPVPAAR